MSHSLHIEELTPLELKQVQDRSGIIYLPLGIIEWHSKHLPFGLDAFVSYELCERACKITGGCVIPPLYFGTDREHKVNGKIFHGMDAKAGELLPGSLYFLTQDLFLNLLRQIVENIKKQGFKKLVIVSAHSGTAQQNVLETIYKEKFGDLKLFIYPGKLFAGGIDHAGPIETSLMLAINRNLVHMNRVDKDIGSVIGENIETATEKDGLIRLEKIVNQIITEVQR